MNLALVALRLMRFACESFMTGNMPRFSSAMAVAPACAACSWAANGRAAAQDFEQQIKQQHEQSHKNSQAGIDAKHHPSRPAMVNSNGTMPGNMPLINPFKRSTSWVSQG
ncbi:MAG: hypothetical protein IPQ22_14085 [Rhodoferax sp.]|nr:hypothetical protein [Rhodoferax sp.]